MVLTVWGRPQARVAALKFRQKIEIKPVSAPAVFPVDSAAIIHGPQRRFRLRGIFFSDYHLMFTEFGLLV